MSDEPAVVDAVAAGTAKLFQASTLTAAWGLVVPVTVTVLELTLALFAGDVMVPVSFGAATITATSSSRRSTEYVQTNISNVLRYSPARTC